MNAKSSITALLATVLTLAVQQAYADNTSALADEIGAVYTMSNAASGNQVLVFARDFQGKLTAAGAVATQGLGMGSGLDALGSQHSLVLSDDAQWLLASNAGSNDISVLHAGWDKLTFSHRIASGGSMPVSIAVSQGVVYVLNAGGTQNISGFHLKADGQLVPIAGSTRVLGATTAYGQIGFDAHGDTLVISDKGGSHLLTFAMAHDLPAATPVITPSNGSTPFGFSFDRKNHLLSVEAASDALSSYALLPNGSLRGISLSVADGQKATCWIATTGDKYAFTTSPGSSAISVYSLDASSGIVSLLNPTAALAGAPLDIDTTASGRFVYALDAGSLKIDAYRVEKSGALTDLGAVPANIAIYAQGIAVR